MQKLDNIKIVSAIIIAVVFTVYVHHPQIFSGVFGLRSKPKSMAVHKTITGGGDGEKPLTIIKGHKQESA